MPFTLAHPAIVLPLKLLPKKWISMTAVLIGSVLPDLEAFIRTYSEKKLTHSWIGLFWFGLPLGLILTFVFHNTVRDPLIINLPEFLRNKFLRFTKFNWNKRFRSDWHVIIISMIIGAASHFFWDSFSDYNGWFLNMFPSLKGNLYIFNGELEIPFLIQYINTLIGVAVIVLFVITLPGAKSNPVKGRPLKFWTTIILLSSVFAFPRFIFLRPNSVDDVIVGSISIFILALLIAAFFFRESASPSQNSGYNTT